MNPFLLLAPLRNQIVLQSGMKRWVVACIAGGASALAMPPFGMFPVFFLTLPVLVWLMDGTAAASGRFATIRAATAVGWWFGFGYFLAGLWWIGAAFMVTPDRHASMMPFAVLALPAGLAVFHGLGLAVARLIWSPGAARIFALAAGLGGAEWLRGHVLTGFPWNSLGYALADNIWLGQSASILGMEGLTFVTIALFAAPACLAIRPLVQALAILAILGVYGGIRLSVAPVDFRDGVSIRIVQPAIQQDDRFRPEIGPQILERYLALSDVATGPGNSGIEGASLLVWPETAFPFLLADAPQALERIASFLPDGTVLATGAIRAEQTADEKKFFNSIQLVDSSAEIRGQYDKRWLVPFGEFLPLDRTLRGLGLDQMIRLPGGFSAGGGTSALILPDGLTLAPLICFEAIFPTAVMPAGPRPQAFLNVTNDAWFGNTPGPYQHAAQARVRAIEQGIPLIRAANSGISAVYDAYGRVVAELPLGTSGALDARLPVSLPSTVYAIAGPWIPFIFFTIFYLSAVLARRRI